MKVGDIVRLKWTRQIAGKSARGCSCCQEFDFRGHAMKNVPFIITIIREGLSWTGRGLAVEAMSPNGTVVDLETYELTTRGPFK